MNPELRGVELRAGDWYYSWNIADWEIPGRDSITIGFTQEPYSFYTIVEDAHVAQLAASLVEGVKFASKNYDFLSVTQKQMPTIENGLATSKIVQLLEGDWVFGEDFERWSRIGELKPGVKYWDANGNLTEYKGGIVTSNQLTVKYEFVDGLTWSDGVPVTKADFELYHKIACDEDSGATSFITCESIQTIEFTDNGYTITWFPGMQDPLYYLAPFGFYPAHRVLSDGRLLADLPAKEWATTPEVARNPIGAGPYVLKEWIPGDRMVFEANPYYYGGTPKTKTIIIKFLDANVIEASLILGDIDFLDSTTFINISDHMRYTERKGLIKIVVIPSAAWEHIDMNLYIK
jgi:ABC-type transport system substrate-binding protein